MTSVTKSNSNAQFCMIGQTSLPTKIYIRQQAICHFPEQFLYTCFITSTQSITGTNHVITSERGFYWDKNQINHKYNIGDLNRQLRLLLHLRMFWLQGTSASVLDKFSDQTKVVKLGCYEIVCDQVKGTQDESYESSKDIKVTGEEVSSQFPEFYELLLFSASHNTLQKKLFHSSKILVPTELLVCVCVCPYFRKRSSSLATGNVDQNHVIIYLILDMFQLWATRSHVLIYTKAVNSTSCL